MKYEVDVRKRSDETSQYDWQNHCYLKGKNEGSLQALTVWQNFGHFHITPREEVVGSTAFNKAKFWCEHVKAKYHARRDPLMFARGFLVGFAAEWAELRAEKEEVKQEIRSLSGSLHYLQIELEIEEAARNTPTRSGPDNFNEGWIR